MRLLVGVRGGIPSANAGVPSLTPFVCHGWGRTNEGVTWTKQENTIKVLFVAMVINIMKLRWHAYWRYSKLQQFLSSTIETVAFSLWQGLFVALSVKFFVPKFWIIDVYCTESILWVHSKPCNCLLERLTNWWKKTITERKHAKRRGMTKLTKDCTQKKREHSYSPLVVFNSLRATEVKTRT